jgi:hypothetical protein
MVMDVWGWIAVYAVGLTLLQLLVYRYLLNSNSSLTRRVGTPFGDRDGDGDRPWSNGSRGSGPPESTRSPRPPDSSHDDRQNANAPTDRRPVDAWPAADTANAPDAPDGSGRTCRNCGATNESDETFSHCWNCAHQL